MRELVFALEYDPGSNPVADLLAESSQSEIYSMSCHATTDSLWRVDRASGTPETLDALAEIVRSSGFYADCLAETECGAPSRTEILHRAETELVFYTYWARMDACASIPHIALEHFGDGLLFETTRAQREYRWRFIIPQEAAASSFFEQVREEVKPFATLETIRMSKHTGTNDQHPNPVEGLPPEQREALRVAAEHGYYETPREVTLDDLADELEIPRSTLSYRLRSAEARLVKSSLGTQERSLAPRF